MRPVLWIHVSDTTSHDEVVSVSNVNLIERVCHLTNKIYREVLCIRRRESKTVITIGGLGLDYDQIELFPFTPNPQYTGRIVLSWNLLYWISVENRIPCSFTNFITTPELSGPLYISPDNYHTQITEYLLHIT